jgi:uncharacterized protein RhaS with RHS repeats
VSTLYDRLGRPSSIVCGATTTSFAYDWANDVLSESYAGGTLGGLTMTNQYDADLRRTNTALLNGAKKFAAWNQSSYRRAINWSANHPGRGAIVLN